MASKQGRQLPTKSLVLKSAKSYGKEAVALYNKSGRTAQKWQEMQLKNLLAQDKQGIWTHSKYAVRLNFGHYF